MVFNPVDINREAPPEYGIDAQHVNVIKIDLSTARTRKPLHIGGVALAVVDASSEYANFELFWKETQNDGYPMRHSSVIRGIKFSRPLITHTAQPGSWVKIAYIAEKDAAQFVDFDIAPCRPIHFSGAALHATASTNFPYFQLWNPATTNKRVLVKEVTNSLSSGGAQISIATRTSALSTFDDSIYDENNNDTGLDVYIDDSATGPGPFLGLGNVLDQYKQGSNVEVSHHPMNRIVAPGESLACGVHLTSVAGFFRFSGYIL